MENKEYMDIFKILDDDDVYDGIIKENLQNRKIVLNETVDDNCIENVCLMIMKWNIEDKDIAPEKRKHIFIYINSDGGEVLAGSQILSCKIGRAHV